MKSIAVFIAVLFFTYLTGAFIAADFNIVHWADHLRGFIAFVGVIAGAISALAFGNL